MIFCVVVSMNVANGGALARAVDHVYLVVRIVAAFVRAKSRSAADVDRIDDGVGLGVDDLHRVDVADVDESRAGNDVDAVGARLVIVRAGARRPGIAAGEPPRSA